MKKISFNKVFSVTCILVLLVVLLFIFSPLLLNCRFIYETISSFMGPLEISEYKSSYIESLGSLLGTFLAVLAALLTQKLFEKSADIKAAKTSVTIVYFDFKFAFKQLLDMFNEYEDSKERKKNKLLDEDLYWYKELKKRFTLSIDKNWIKNVAKLSSFLSENEIQAIYTIYGDLESVLTAFKNDLTEEEMNNMVGLFCLKYFNKIKSTKLDNIEKNLKLETQQLMYKLKGIISSKKNSIQ